MSALRELLAIFKIEVDHKEVEKGENAIASFKEKLVKFGETLAVTFAVERIKGFLEEQIAAGAELQKTAEKIGTETNELQALELAANKAGVSSESLATGLRFLNRNISEAATKGGEHAALFKKLGVAIKDTSGHARPAGDVLQDFADSIAKIEDPARQVEVAMKLLGRGGVELLPLLKEGGEAFEEARKQLAALGGGMSKDFVKQAHDAERANALLKVGMTGLKSEIAGAMLPTFMQLIRVGTQVAMNLRQMAKEPGALAAGFKALAVVAALAAPEVTLIAAGAGILYLAIDELYGVLKGNDSLIGDALGPDKKKFVDDLRGAIDVLNGSLGQDSEEIDGATGSWQGFKDVIVAVDKVLASIVEAMAWIVDKADLVGDLLASMSTDTAKANVGWDSLKARWADEGTGKHENLKKYLSDLKAKQRKEREDEDAKPGSEASEQERERWLAAVRDRDEWEAHNKERVAGGQKPIPIQPELADFFNQHANPFPTIPGAGAPGAPSVPGVPGVPPGQGGPPVDSTVINQTNNTTIDIQGADVSDPEATKAAVGQGVTTGVQRGNNRALTAMRQP
jgi:hypothetical protein